MPVVRIRFDGVHSSSEEWSFGFHVQTEGSINDVGGDLGVILGSAWASGAGWTNQATLNRLYIAELNGLGETVESAEVAVSIAGNQTNESLPPQTAVVVTLLPVSGVRKGRFYLPPFSRTHLTTAGLLNSATRDAVAVGWAGILGDLSDDGHVPGIWSPTATEFIAARAVRVGNVFDTQRRRRKSLTEAYASSNI